MSIFSPKRRRNITILTEKGEKIMTSVRDLLRWLDNVLDFKIEYHYLVDIVGICRDH